MLSSLGLWAWTAGAEPTAPVRVHWQAPAGCPTAADVEAAIAVRTGRAPTLAGPAMLVADVEVVKAGPNWIGALVISSPSGRTRESLADPSCAVVAEAVAVKVALAVTALAPSEPTPSEPTPAPSRSNTPALVPIGPQCEDPPPPSASPRPSARTRRRGVPGVWMRLAGGIDVASLPRFGAIGGLGIGLRWRWAYLAGTVVALAPRGFRLRSTPRAGADLSAWAPQLIGCVNVDLGAFDLRPCAALELAVVVADPRGLDSGRRVRQLRPALGPSAGFRHRPRPWIAFGFDVEVPIALRRVAFSIDDAGAIYRVPGIAARALAVLEVRLDAIGSSSAR